MVTTRLVVFPGVAASFANITMHIILKKKKKRNENDVSGASNCFVNDHSVGTDL